MSKRKNLKIIFSTSRQLDIQKLKQVFVPEIKEDISESQEFSVIKIDYHRIPLNLRTNLPAKCLEYFERIKLFMPVPRVYYLEKPTYDYLEKAVDTVYTIHQMAKGEGDIQVFFTGNYEASEFIQKFEVTRSVNKL